MGASPPDTAAVGGLPGVDEAVALGLTRSEYVLICDKLGRAPNQVELAMFSLLWSEHCAYKHSKKLLRTLPTEGPAVVMGLMPHPEHAVDPLTGSVDGLELFASMAQAVPAGV